MKFPLQALRCRVRENISRIFAGKILMLYAAILVTSVASLLKASPASASMAIKTRTVDMQKVLVQSDVGKKAKEQLSLKAAGYEAEKSIMEDKLKKLKIELEKSDGSLSENARSAKEKDYLQKLKEYQSFLKNAQDDLQAENDKLTGKIVDKILKVIQDFGRKKDYSFILVKNEAMIYVDETVDVTDEVLDYFNRSSR